VVTCKTKDLQNICKNVLVFYFHVTKIFADVSQMFYATTFAKICKNVAKHLQKNVAKHLQKCFRHGYV